MSKEALEQLLGIDIGRGYAKGYSEYRDNIHECCFKSIIALGRDMDFSEQVDPIYIEVNNDDYEEDYFVGYLAETEGDNPIHVLADDKTTTNVQKLIWAVLHKIAIADRVKINLGVPNKLFTKSVLNKVIETYKGKEITIKDKITGSYKKVTIVDITIFREADSALLWHTETNIEGDIKRPIGLVSVGFRTTEFSYYDENLKYNDKLSTSTEIGNKSALEYVQRKLKANQVTRTLAEIDTSDKYDKLKKVAYNNLTNSIENEIETMWLNRSEMDIYIAGGTSLYLELQENYKSVPTPQMATAKGLYTIAKCVLA